MKKFDQEAKMIVDSLFHAKIFRDDFTRIDVSELEEVIREFMESRLESYLRLTKFIDKVNNPK